MKRAFATETRSRTRFFALAARMLLLSLYCFSAPSGSGVVEAVQLGQRVEPGESILVGPARLSLGMTRAQVENTIPKRFSIREGPPGILEILDSQSGLASPIAQVTIRNGKVTFLKRVVSTINGDDAIALFDSLHSELAKWDREDSSLNVRLDTGEVELESPSGPFVLKVINLRLGRGTITIVFKDAQETASVEVSVSIGAEGPE